MSYWIVFLLLVGLVAAVLAMLSGNPLAWARRERALIAADTFASDSPHVGTMQDPRCAATLERLRLARVEMKLRGTKLLLEDREPWRRVVTGPELQKPKHPADVVPMRRRNR